MFNDQQPIRQKEKANQNNLSQKNVPLFSVLSNDKSSIDQAPLKPSSKNISTANEEHTLSPKQLASTNIKQSSSPKRPRRSSPLHIEQTSALSKSSSEIKQPLLLPKNPSPKYIAKPPALPLSPKSPKKVYSAEISVSEALKTAQPELSLHPQSSKHSTSFDVMPSKTSEAIKQSSKQQSTDPQPPKSPKSPKLPKLPGFQTVTPKPPCSPKRRPPKLEIMSQIVNEQYSELKDEKSSNNQYETDSKYAIHDDGQISPIIKKSEVDPEEKVIIQPQPSKILNYKVKNEKCINRQHETDSKYAIHDDDQLFPKVRKSEEKSDMKSEEKAIIPFQLPEIPKDIKGEDIEVNIVQLRKLSHYKSRSLIDFFRGRNQEIDYYLKLKPFFDSLNLTKEDVKDIHLKELDQLVHQDWYGKFLNAYASNHVFFKIFAFWLLNEAGIKLNKLKQSDLIGLNAIALDEIIVKNSQDKAKENSIGKNNQNNQSDINSSSNVSNRSYFYSISQCLENFKQYLSSRVWPKNRILLFEDQTLLAKAHSIEAATKSLKWFNKMWTVLITSLLANDIYFYYAYPEQRYDNTLYKILTSGSEHTKMLSSSVTSVTVWPELIAFPSFLLITEALWKRFHPSHSIETKDISAIQEYWNNYEPTLKQDLFYPLLNLMAPSFLSKFFGLAPFPTTEYNYNNLLKTLLWDGNAKANDRLEIFRGLKTLLNKSSKLTHINVLALFEALAEHIHSQDIQRLNKKGYDKDTIKALLQIQSESLLELKKQTKWNGIGSIFFLLYAHFLLWNIGQSETNIAQPYFLAFQTYRWYATIKFFMTLIAGIKLAIDLYLAKKACEAEGKLWIYMDQVVDYKCTVCGDLPIYYGSIFANEDCIKAWFETKMRTSQELIDFAEGSLASHIDFSSMKILNFDKQYLNGKDLMRFLAGLKKRASNLQEVNLSMLRFSSGGVQNIDNIGLQAISDLLVDSSISKLILKYQRIKNNFTILCNILPYSKIQVLDLSFNSIGNEESKELGQVLNSSNLEVLDLGLNPIGADGAKALGQGLPNSRLKSLTLSQHGYLPDNVIGDEGAQGLALGLAGSNLQMLTLSSCGIRYTGAIALMENLANSTLEELYLQNNQIFLIALPEQNLNYSNLKILDLSVNSLSNDDAEKLGQGLPHSKLQILDLSGNNIGVEGARALAQGLKDSQLQILYLSVNSMGNDSWAMEFGKWLNVSSMKELYLGGSIGDEGIRGLASGLPGSMVESLAFSANIGLDSVKIFAQKLSESTVSALYLGGTISIDGEREIGRLLNASKLEKLSLLGSNISVEGAKSLGQWLNISTVKKLLFKWYAHIGEEGAIAIGNGLPGSQLEQLSLGNNDIGDIGATSLGRGLSQSALQELNLVSNEIGDIGIKELGIGMSKSPLRSLVLGGNNIGPAGIRDFSSELLLSNLEELFLYGDDVGDIGAEALGLGLPGSKLKKLDLDGTNLNSENIKKLMRGIPNSNVKHLHIKNNDIGDIGAITIANFLVTNSKLFDSLWIQRFDPDFKRSLGQSVPNTNLEFLDLRDNGITDMGAEPLCRILPYSGIPFSRDNWGVDLGLDLNSNPINDEDLLYDCIISAASPQFELPFHFRMIGNMYSWIKDILWPTKYIQTFDESNSIVVKKVDEGKDKNIESNNLEDLNWLISNRNELLEVPLFSNNNTFELWNRPNVNYQINYQRFPALSLPQLQDNSTIPSLLMFFIFGIMLLWIYKKIFALEAENKTTPQHKKVHRRNLFITNLSHNPNTFWPQFKPISSHLTQKFISDAVFYHR